MEWKDCNSKAWGWLRPAQEAAGVEETGDNDAVIFQWMMRMFFGEMYSVSKQMYEHQLWAQKFNELTQRNSFFKNETEAVKWAATSLEKAHTMIMFKKCMFEGGK